MNKMNNIITQEDSKMYMDIEDDEPIKVLAP